MLLLERMLSSLPPFIPPPPPTLWIGSRNPPLIRVLAAHPPLPSPILLPWPLSPSKRCSTSKEDPVLAPVMVKYVCMLSFCFYSFFKKLSA